MTEPIPYFAANLDDRSVDAVERVLRSGWLTTGGAVAEFESAFAEYTGAPHVVALNSCTAALHLALVAAGIGPGDDVIVPTMTFAATAEVVAYVGANLVLVDVDPDTLCIDAKAVEAAVSSRTRAVMPVHYGGQAANLDAIRSAVGPDVIIIEDAAHALPTEIGDRRVGADADVACFSFYANKTITTGEGGMLTTTDGEIAQRAKRLSLHGLSRDAWSRWETRAKWDYDILEAGFKYNLTDIAGALGVEQLRRCDEFAAQRRAHARLYLDLLGGLPGVSPVSVADHDSSAWHLMSVRVNPTEAGFTRDDVIAALTAEEIGSSVHYKPLHLHPLYADRYPAVGFPVATTQFSQLVSLPLFPSITTAQVERVVACIDGLKSADLG